MPTRLDALVVGSGPNGLAAAITVARTGRKVLVLEAERAIGGGCRSEELTLPGFLHDVCSAVHPLGVASPFFRTLALEEHGLEWIEPTSMLAHPFDDGSCLLVERSLEATRQNLGPDGDAYHEAIGALVEDWPRLESWLIGSPRRWPRHPLGLAGFGLRALRSAEGLARRAFSHPRTRALFAGVAAHAMVPLDFRATAGLALGLAATAHTAGWVIPRGGSQRIADALASRLRSLGGEIETGRRVLSIDELPPARAIFCDLSPRPLLSIAGHRFPASYRRRLERYRYGMGAFKIDWALDGAIPWRNPDCARAATVHLGGSLEEIARSEEDAWNGRVSERPFVLLAQPTLFDPSRAPEGRHVVWTYCHVPLGSDADMSSRIEDQIERFAPGFRRRVLGRSIMAPADFERRNANFVGGDIGSGANTLGQLLARPTWRTHSTPVPGLYLCSAATPPGVGVHGLCGYFAARRALKEVLRN